MREPAVKMVVVVMMVVGGGVPFVMSACPSLANSGGLFQANITWIYDSWDYTCTVTKDNSSTETALVEGETKNLGEDCIRITCGTRHFREVFLSQDSSTCSYNGSCGSEVYSSACPSEPYRCYTAVHRQIGGPYYTNEGPFPRYKKGWFTVFSGYTCGLIGSGPCGDDKCFNPLADPSKNATEERQCLSQGEEYVSADFAKYQCQQYTACGNTYLNFTFVQRGCNNNGAYVSPGHVTWSDPCRETKCVVTDNKGELVTSFKGEEGCAHDDQCVTVNHTISAKLIYTCASLTCRKNTTLSPPEFTFHSVDTGCLAEGSCHADGDLIDTDVDCKKLICRQKSAEEYAWDNQFTGCFSHTRNCTHADGQSYILPDCIKNTCVTADYAQWRTKYTGSGCIPKKKCKNQGIPGCKYGNTCYPVKSVITVDECTQFVCYSNDSALNQNSYVKATPKPKWKARAIGCYGPKGCMQFGRQYVDPDTLNTYRCSYELGGLGTKVADFHKACVAPNGTTLALGNSVLIGSVWYSCYRKGKMKNPVDQSVKPTTTHTCGWNSDTGTWKYTKLPYYTERARCVVVGTTCEDNCNYFDQPCQLNDTHWRKIGDKFTLNGSECVCTQDYEVNNKPFTESRFNTPSLCGEQGVTDGACKDPDNGTVVRQWGEMWTRPSDFTPLQVCACHPLNRNAFCSTYLPDVVDVLTKMKI